MILPAVVSTIIPYRLRSRGTALIGVYVFLFGAFFGAVLTGMLSDAYGTRTALTIIVLPSTFIGGALIALGARHIRRDMAMVVEELREEQEDRQRRTASTSATTPVLQVRNLDFSYGSVQVLFDVGLDVHEGETLALLGTNGAGKSTLLRVISGLGVAERGVVRLHGRTVTYADPELRVRDRHRATHRRRRDVPAAHRRREPRAWPRSSTTATSSSAASTNVLDLFPMLRERHRHAGRRPLGRPAADAGARDGARARTRGAHHRRAVARPRADRRAAGARRRAAAPRTRA